MSNVIGRRFVEQQMTVTNANKHHSTTPRGT